MIEFVKADNFKRLFNQSQFNQEKNFTKLYYMTLFVIKSAKNNEQNNQLQRNLIIFEVNIFITVEC